MIIRPTDVHADYMVALAGVTKAGQLLDIEVSCKLQSMWLIKADEHDRATFIELAKEEGLKALERL